MSIQAAPLRILPRWLASGGGLSATVKSTFTAASLFSYIFRRQDDVAGLLKVASCHQVCSYLRFIFPCGRALKL
jgi:hypothetical protein